MEVFVLWYIGWMFTEGYFEVVPQPLGEDGEEPARWYQLMFQWPLWLGRAIAFQMRPKP